MLPLMLNVSDKLVVVVGGGAVARRKILASREAGASVRVICLDIPPTGEQDPRIDWLTTPYNAGHLTGATLVFAAATPEINAQVVADARSRNVLVMDAADPERGDFHTPAVARLGSVVVAVSTSGASPSLAATLRDQIEKTLDPTLADWVALLREMRPLILSQVAPDRRPELFATLADDIWLTKIKRLGTEVVRAEMLASIERASY